MAEKNFRLNKFFSISAAGLCIGLSIAITSCVPLVGNNSTRSRSSANSLSGSSAVALYQGRILADNPIILSKNDLLSDTYDLNKLLTTANITTNSFLKGSGSCTDLEYCFEVRQAKESPSALQTVDGKWAFGVYTPEFLQVNTYYHLNLITELFFNNLTQSFDRSYFGSVPYYDSSLPKSIQSVSNPNSFKIITTPLIAFADCDAADNAYFDHTNQTLCMGYLSGHPQMKWAQDSTVIYHETGHFFQKLQVNLRNPLLAGAKVDMGGAFYDEAGALGEGLSDYYSYYANGRTHFSEWAAGRYLNSSRPIAESDPVHTAGVSADPDQRLSYPQFLNYNPNEATIPTEDIHYAGMPISHYLVALTEDLKTTCLLSSRNSSDMVMHLITETLAELGDLSSNGTQSVTTQNKVNLNSSYSNDWYRLVNPINYRSFMQTFAKNLKNNLSGLNRCNGSAYSQDQIESLIDQYGLLLFRTYNQNRNLSTTSGTFINTPINATNRKKSVLISKNLLILDPTANSSSAYVIDNHDQIKNLISTLQTGGIIGNLSPLTPSDFGFNNDNGKMSPGEVVALALNLYNNSNSPMAGIQILANDWNHAYLDTITNSIHPYQFPASLSNDQWPLVSEGGIVYPCLNDPCAIDSAGNTLYRTFTTDQSPICFIQSNETNSTKWISQKDYAKKIGMSDFNSCLDKDKPNECFIRAIKGADQSYYSKINPKSTWAQTMANPTTGKAPALDGGNVILFELSKNIPPGTVVDCRLRVRFTNCEDCFHDDRIMDSTNKKLYYDFKDIDYNGPRPFKIIHLQIPITD